MEEFSVYQGHSELVTRKTQRPPRADARRNREHVIEVARRAFIAGETDISFDELAKRAHVGAGTLYRHFPNRETLIAAVYREDIERLSEAAEKLAHGEPPLEALRLWMLLFVDYIATKKLIAGAVNASVDGGNPLLKTSAEIIRRAIGSLATRAIDSGELDPNVDALDLLRALVGVSNVSASPDWHSSARRLVGILIKGASRTRSSDFAN